jgi:circadian clock protein KaiC
VLAIVAQHGVLGSMQTPLDLSYLADNVVLFRFFETEGRVRQALSVLKRRAGAHERTIRELELGSAGLVLSEPLSDLQGVMTGVPQILGGRQVRIDAQ